MSQITVITMLIKAKLTVHGNIFPWGLHDERQYGLVGDF